jgi:hypothetical protein
MSSANQFDRGGTALLGLLLALGLIIGGWLLGAQIKATRLSDRYVTVKGLVERNVKSDLAIWPLSYRKLETICLCCTRRRRPTRKLYCSSSISRACSLLKLNWRDS